MIVRKLFLCAMLVTCLALAGPVWAGSINFNGVSTGQGTLNFIPTAGNTLTIGAGGGGNGALISVVLDDLGVCTGGGCAVTGGYLTLSSGAYLGGGGCSGGTCNYAFGSGGTIDIFGGVASKGIANGSLLATATFNNGSFSANGTVGTFLGTLNIASISLNSLFGYPTLFTGGSGDAITINLNGGCTMGGQCTGLVTNAGMSLQTPVPEPATLSILGAGLLALGTGLRRKFLSA